MHSNNVPASPSSPFNPLLTTTDKGSRPVSAMELERPATPLLIHHCSRLPREPLELSNPAFHASLRERRLKGPPDFTQRNTVRGGRRRGGREGREGGGGREDCARHE